MPRIRKQILAPGTYWTASGPVEFTSDDISHFDRQAKDMLAAGLAIPVPLEHQDAGPADAAAKMAHHVGYNTGWLAGSEVDANGVLWHDLDVSWLPDAKSDADIQSRLSNTIRYVSPEIRPVFVDGTGKRWERCITHVALTAQPIWYGQQPFGTDGAAASGVQLSAARPWDASAAVRLSALDLWCCDPVLAHAADWGEWADVLQLAVNRAPAGGVTVNGKHYPGGRFIPGAELDKDPEAKKKVEAHTEDRKAKLRTAVKYKGHEALAADVAEHGHVQLDKNDMASARKAWAGMKAHHDDLALHHVQRQIARDKAALADLPEDEEGKRAYFQRRLRAYGHMLEWAKGEGFQPAKDEEPKAVPAGRISDYLDPANYPTKQAYIDAEAERLRSILPDDHEEVLRAQAEQWAHDRWKPPIEKGKYSVGDSVRHGGAIGSFRGVFTGEDGKKYAVVADNKGQHSVPFDELEHGDSKPPEVLADYPDLQPKAASAAALASANSEPAAGVQPTLQSKASELERRQRGLARLYQEGKAGTPEYADAKAKLDKVSDEVRTLQAEQAAAKPARKPAAPKPPPPANPAALAAEAKNLYDRAASPDVKPEHIDGLMDRMAGMKKDDLLKAAVSMGLHGMEAKSRDAILARIKFRILDRKGATQRAGLIEPPTNPVAKRPASRADDDYDVPPARPITDPSQLQPQRLPEKAVPAPPVPQPLPAGAGVDAAALAQHAKAIYENAAKPEVSAAHIDGLMGALQGMSKADAAAVAEGGLGMRGMATRSKADILEQIKARIVGRKGATIRAGLIDPISFKGEPGAGASDAAAPNAGDVAGASDPKPTGEEKPLTAEEPGAAAPLPTGKRGKQTAAEKRADLVQRLTTIGVTAKESKLTDGSQGLVLRGNTKEIREIIKSHGGKFFAKNSKGEDDPHWVIAGPRKGSQFLDSIIGSGADAAKATIEKTKASDAAYQQKLAEEAAKPAGEAVLPFGKHSGSKLKDVPRDYLQWMYANATALREPLKSKILQHLRETAPKPKPPSPPVAKPPPPPTPTPAAAQQPPPGPAILNSPPPSAPASNKAHEIAAKHGRTPRGDERYGGQRNLGFGKRHEAIANAPKVGEIVQGKDGPMMVTSVGDPRYYSQSDLDDFDMFDASPGWNVDYRVTPVERTPEEHAEATRREVKSKAGKAALEVANSFWNMPQFKAAEKLPEDAYPVGDKILSSVSPSQQTDFVVSGDVVGVTRHDSEYGTLKHVVKSQEFADAVRNAAAGIAEHSGGSYSPWRGASITAPKAENRLSHIPPGQSAYVRGHLVTRNDSGGYSLETERGKITSEPEILERIERNWKDQEPDRKRIDAALARAAGHQEPAWYAPEAQEAGRAFAALPKGARVVSLGEHTKGRLGTVVKRTTDDGRTETRVRLDGDPVDSQTTDVEPLDEQHSWRSSNKPAKQSQPVNRPLLFSAKSSGQWITIGGKKGEDGKRAGGSPVYVENGRITKWHPSLTGRSLDNIDAGPDKTTRQKEVREGKSYDRAVWSKKAKKAGVNPDHLHSLAKDMLAHDRAHKETLKSMLQDARKALGGNASNLSKAFKDGDYSRIPGFDTTARSLSTAYPELLGNHGYDTERNYDDNADEASQKLYDLLSSGNPEPMTEQDAYEQAWEYMENNGAFDRPAETEKEPWDLSHARAGICNRPARNATTRFSNGTKGAAPMADELFDDDDITGGEPEEMEGEPEPEANQPSAQSQRIEEAAADLAELGVIVDPSKNASDFLEHLCTALKTHKATKAVHENGGEPPPDGDGAMQPTQEPQMVAMSHKLTAAKKEVQRLSALVASARERDLLADVQELQDVGELTEEDADQFRKTISTKRLSLAGAPDADLQKIEAVIGFQKKSAVRRGLTTDRTAGLQLSQAVPAPNEADFTATNAKAEQEEIIARLAGKKKAKVGA